MNPETVNTIEQITIAVILAIPAAFSLGFLYMMIKDKA